jgi:hypothetical protein
MNRKGIKVVDGVFPFWRSSLGHRQSLQHRSVKLPIQLVQCSDNLGKHLGIAADQLKVSSNLDNLTVIGKAVRKLRHWCVMGEY